MDTDTIKQKLDDLDRGQIEIIRRLDDMAENLNDTIIEIGGVPDELGRDPHRRSIRARIHDLEVDRTTAKIATSALDAAKELHRSSAEKRFTKREKLAGLAVAFLVATGPYISPVLFHHHP